MSALPEYIEESVAEKALIQLEEVTKTYDAGENAVQALRGVDVAIQEGEFVAIIGPSGSGKSTLMHILGCLDSPSEGKYWLDGQDVAEHTSRELARIRNQKIGFVFQGFNLLPRTTAIENVELPMAEAKMPGTERVERARELLAYVGLSARRDHRPSQLSGGEQQRVAIARALANKPRILLADEPTGELDAKTGTEMIGLMGQVNYDGTTIIVVTHDEELASAASRVVHMRDGVVVDDRRQNVR